MDPEPKQNMKNSTKKKAIVIVGKMGHGKSSFLKMLIQKRIDNLSFQQVQAKESEIQKSEYHDLMAGEKGKEIIIQAGGKNVHPSHELLENGDRLYAIDTPGLDSDEAACLITEQIDDIIVENNFQIVGIAYAIDISVRQEGRSGHTYFGEFVKLLKLRKIYKKNIIFCLATKWDRHYDDPENLQEYLKCLKEILQKNQCALAYEKLIRWSSKPEKGFDRYRRKFLQGEQKQGRDIVQRQWKQLSETIRIQNQKNICPLSLYQADHRQFWRKVMKNIMLLFQKEDKSTAFQKQECIFPVEINKEKIKFKVKNALIPVFTSGALNLARFSLAFLVPSVALTGPIGISILVTTLVVGTAFTAREVLKKVMNNYKLKTKKGQKILDDSSLQMTKKQLQAKLQFSITNNLCDEFISKLEIQDNIIRIPKLYWLQQPIDFFYENKLESKFATATRSKNQIKLNMEENIKEIKIICKTKVWVPKLEGIAKILRQVSEQVYGK